MDVANVYRFGACAHDTVHAVWLEAESPPSNAYSARSLFRGAAIIDESTLLVHDDVRAMTRTGLAARVAHEDEDGGLILSVTTSVLAQMVRIGSAAYAPEDSYFTLCPGVERRVRLGRLPYASSAPICVEAVNDPTAVQLNVVPSVPLPAGGGLLMLPNARRVGTTSVPAVC